MRLSSFSYALRDALRSLWRNKFMTVASVATVAISLLILGAAWLLVLNSNYLASAMESELEINVYLKDDVPREEAVLMEEVFADIAGVAEVVFVPREKGLQELEDRFSEDTGLLEALGDRNPLPDIYRLKANDAVNVPAIAEMASSLDRVENVRYGQGLVERLLALTDWLHTAGVVMIVAIAVASVFLIATTIRLTVFARRREIGIMKLVGATNWYIRWPFFLEGMLIGFMGAAIAVGVIHLFYAELTKNIASTVSFVPIMTDRTMLNEIFRNLLLLGTGLGALGSAVSLRRFLKV
ncbi:MAG: permease-like cell division protein FtsX [Clostridia bacterium]|jgi:cell division transport system permease protein|nr:permease-like cell division protein FtsX [Clostridia bacterium]